MAQNLETPKLTSELLNERNYPTWARAVSFALSGRGKIGHVSGTKKKPEAKTPAQPTDAEKVAIEEWQMTDHQVMTFIFNCIEPRLAKLFMHTDSAKQLWDKLETTYGNRHNHSYIYQLKQQIYQARQASRTNTEYLVELQSRFDELNGYLPPTSDPAVLLQRQMHEQIYIYLGGLDASYEILRSQILSNQELPPFQSVVAMVQREETRRAVMTPDSEPLPETQALAAKNFSRTPP